MCTSSHRYILCICLYEITQANLYLYIYVCVHIYMYKLYSVHVNDLSVCPEFRCSSHSPHALSCGQVTSCPLAALLSPCV